MLPVIQVENLSKAYQIGEFSTGTLSNDIERWWLRKRGKEDRFLKIRETNDHTVKGESDFVWSLKDINFQIEQGEAVGIIGRNGAGKSTLLKILTRVTSPTTGSIKVKGKIASLLEVGTGFHPELTGRENIFLNGAILGMRKQEIKRKFDEIVEFSGVQRYIDTPVKRYSSGMYVRLAFAVAAHLESEILIVDEVLAVGDAEFQKKCLGKMSDVSKGEGRTVLFVSHNMEAMLKLCPKSIFLENGHVVQDGKTSEVTNTYLKSSDELKEIIDLTQIKRSEGTKLSGNANFKSVRLINDNFTTWKLKYKQPIVFQFEIEVKKDLQFIEIGIALSTNTDFEIASSLSSDYRSFTNVSKGNYVVTFSYIDFHLLPNSYRAGFGIRSENALEDLLPSLCEFEVIISEVSAEDKTKTRNGIIIPKISCTIN